MAVHPELMLERLRKHRSGGGPDFTLIGALGAEQQRLARSARTESRLGRAWEKLVPAHLAARIRPVSLRAGVLTVRSSDASSDLQFSQWLRGGGQRRLAKMAGRPVRRVRSLF